MALVAGTRSNGLFAKRSEETVPSYDHLGNLVTNTSLSRFETRHISLGRTRERPIIRVPHSSVALGIVIDMAVVRQLLAHQPPLLRKGNDLVIESQNSLLNTPHDISTSQDRSDVLG